MREIMYLKKNSFYGIIIEIWATMDGHTVLKQLEIIK